MRKFEAPKAGQKIRSADLQDMLSEVYKISQMKVEGGTLFNGPGGITLSIDKENGFWAKITANGTSGKYSWEAVDLNLDGTGWVTSASGKKGNYNTDAAIELNFTSTVATNTIVWLFPPIAGKKITSPQDRTPLYHLFFVGGGGGGGGNTMDCPHVTSVQCTGGLLTVGYDVSCVSV